MSKQNSEKSTPWVDGYYRMHGMDVYVYLVNGERVQMIQLSAFPDPALLRMDPTLLTEALSGPEDPLAIGSWQYGDYGEAKSAITEKSGASSYNVEMTFWMGKLIIKGVLLSCGKKIHVIGFDNAPTTYEWISEEELIAFIDSGDSVDAPSSHYKVQPEYQGKLLWITGPPGAGKSTSGQMLSKIADYVYYEADAFMSNANPYIPPDAAEPSLATFKQKPLRGVPQERIDATAKGTKSFMDMIERKEYDIEPILDFYSAMCKDIATERSRLGGDWVVAQAVTSRLLRDHMRTQLGPELIFVILHMSQEEQSARAKGRHGDMEEVGEFLSKMHDLYEPAGEDEPKTVEITITQEMSREDVCQIIMDRVENIK